MRKRDRLRNDLTDWVEEGNSHPYNNRTPDEIGRSWLISFFGGIILFFAALGAIIYFTL